MRKCLKVIGAMALSMALIGGFTEFFGPSVRIDEEYWDSGSSLEAWALAPIISAEGAVLIREKDGSVIYEKDADEKMYPASITKIMTCLVTLEILEEIDGDVDSKVKIPKEAVGIEGSSVYLKEGEIVTVEELLYGAMLQSGNDAATALALCLGGDIETFVKKMNEKAKELGCTKTRFTNPTGLYDENHYTTARDMAKIARAAMNNSCFRKVAGSTSWESKDSGRNFVNKNKTISEFNGATGVKIGYTKKSGRTLVASAQRDDVGLIAVVLNDPNWFEDAYAMLEYGFEREGVRTE